jgi:hypothetical protein
MTDDVTYVFENDESVIGKWQYFDFVQSELSFDPHQSHWAGEIIIDEIEFLPDGLIEITRSGNSYQATPKWTKGHMINEIEETNSSYHIRVYDEVEYLFLEWKSGDYIYRDMEPYYYVFRRMV